MIWTPAIQPTAHCYNNWANLNPITSTYTFHVVISYEQASTVFSADFLFEVFLEIKITHIQIQGMWRP
jgi:hypothetical protein